MTKLLEQRRELLLAGHQDWVREIKPISRTQPRSLILSRLWDQISLTVHSKNSASSNTLLDALYVHSYLEKLKNHGPRESKPIAVYS